MNIEESTTQSPESVEDVSTLALKLRTSNIVIDPKFTSVDQASLLKFFQNLPSPHPRDVDIPLSLTRESRGSTDLETEGGPREALNPSVKTSSPILIDEESLINENKETGDYLRNGKRFRQLEQELANQSPVELFNSTSEDSHLCESREIITREDLNLKQSIIKNPFLSHSSYFDESLLVQPLSPCSSSRINSQREELNSNVLKIREYELVL